MESIRKDHISFPHVCAFCGNAGINKCGRCRAMHYCCREHQLRHWPIHKKSCKKSSSSVPVSTNINLPSSSMSFSSPDNRNRNVNEEINKNADLNSPGNRNVAEKQSLNLNLCTSLNDACMQVIKDLNTIGICVLNDFMGSSIGNLILEEVENLYKKGTFQQGKLVASHPNVSAEDIRSDVNTWVIGTEPECKNIGHLIGKIDVLIATCNNMPNSGMFSSHKLLKRTKVMVACYPGNGTCYTRHIDNPNKDGRCVTCVYYLNHNWNNKTHGGVLRVYPVTSSQSYDIEPVFDRLVMFWSDKRVPHEVLPAFATRFATTVWYFDADEREAALKRFAEGAKMKSSN